MDSQAEDSRVKFLFRRKVAKILEGLVYVASKMGNSATRHNVGKVFYYADRGHLAKFGRMIFDDTYVAMKDGPVPSIAYDLIKQSAGVNRFWLIEQCEIAEALGASGAFDLHANRSPNLDCFSKSELGCLDAAITFCKGKSFKELSDISHDAAWRSADRNNDISLKEIVRDLNIEDTDILEDYISQEAMAK